MTPDDFARVLMMTESGGNMRAWGDDGLAMGCYQCHPVWLERYAREYSIRPKLDDSINTWAGAVIREFFVRRSPGITPVSIAMEYHLGHESQPAAPDWDEVYANRFSGWTRLLNIVS